MRAPLAVVTMVYNEPVFLPVWLRHYASQAGMAACHVIDHGSDDGSTNTLPCNVLRLPRSPQDDARRTRMIGLFCASLLEWYEAVIYCDVDEILVADPALYGSLAELSQACPAPCLTATGFDLLHRITTEPALDFSAPILTQRSALRFSAAMCKPCLIREPVTWSPGFHSIREALPNPDPALMLFHLRYCDLDEGLNRLARTRAQPWCNEDAGAHQRMADEPWREMLGNMAGLPFEPATLGEEDPALKTWRQRLIREGKERAQDPYPIDLGLSGDKLWAVPDRLKTQF